MNTIPVIELDGDAWPSSRQTKAIGDALRDVGFFSLVGHGIDEELIKSAYSVAERFFALPDEIKKKYEIEELQGRRGFTSFGRESAKGCELFDLKEFYHTGRDSLRPNLWPTEIVEYQYIMSRFFNEMNGIGSHVLGIIAEYLGEYPGTFINAVAEGDTVLRAIHYPPIPTRLEGHIRAAPHEDINLITLLCESTAPGLELLQADGSWLPIHRQEGQIIVNSCDMLHNWSNGILRSTTHRVVNPESVVEQCLPRLSMPCFIHPHPNTDLSPLETCIEKVGKQVTRNITAGDFLQERLDELGL